jgi:hypothetical protein
MSSTAPSSCSCFTGLSRRDGVVERKSPGYIPADVHGTYATSKSAGTCKKTHNGLKP